MMEGTFEILPQMLLSKLQEVHGKFFSKEGDLKIEDCNQQSQQDIQYPGKEHRCG